MLTQDTAVVESYTRILSNFCESLSNVVISYLPIRSQIYSSLPLKVYHDTPWATPSFQVVVTSDIMALHPLEDYLAFLM